METKQIVTGVAAILLSAQALALGTPSKGEAASIVTQEQELGQEVIIYATCMPPLLPHMCN